MSKATPVTPVDVTLLDTPTATPTASRPKMQDYGISNETEGMMTWAWAEEQLVKSRNYWIVTSSLAGKPHAAPVWGVWLAGKLFFGSGDTSRKVRNFKRNPNVVMHLESGDNVVTLEGTIAEMRDHEHYLQIAELYAAKYDFNPASEPTDSPMFYAFIPRVGLTWLEESFPKTATRWTFQE